MTRHCRACHQPLNGPRSRLYCTPECHTAHVRRDRQERLDEFKWIAGTDTWENIAHRLGWPTVDSLERFLARMGEHEWAARVHDTGMPRTYSRAA